MLVRTIDETISVGPQITAEEVARLAARGFRTVICNRPDGEDPSQTPFEEIRRAAAEHGIEAVHIPVPHGEVGHAQLGAFTKALKEMPRPVFAYCRSGGRALTLAAMAGHGR
jgi:sulfide:quinone oxidoreductase